MGLGELKPVESKPSVTHTGIEVALRSRKPLPRGRGALTVRAG